MLLLNRIADRVLDKKITLRKNVFITSTFGKSVWIDITAATIEIKGNTHLMVIFRDETERVEADRSLRESELKFRQLAENIGQVFWLRTDKQMLYISPVYEKIWGRTCESLYSTPDSFAESIHPDDKAAVLKDFREKSDHFDMEYRIVRPDGDIRWIQARSFPVYAEDGISVRRAGIAEDITLRRAMEEQLRENSIRDPLTEVYNRRYVFENLKGMINRFSRDDEPFSIAIIDLDHFKKINDTYGHVAGDYVLREFSRIVSDNIRPYDILGRYGGEEFIIVFKKSKRDYASSTIERILDIIRGRVFSTRAGDIKLTFSCGIADVTEEFPGGRTIENIVAAADERLYRAKSGGRNMVVF